MSNYLGDSHWTNIYGSISELEKSFRSFIKSLPPDDEKVTHTFSRVRSLVEQLMLENISFAHGRSVEQLLWKGLTYKIIEEYRKQLALFEKQTGKKAEVKAQMRKMELHFRSFLQEMNGFYISLVDRLCVQHELEHVANVLHDPDVKQSYSRKQKKMNLSDAQQLVLQSCHRSLVYLGDLARYLEQRNERNPKDFIQAKSFYEKAFVLLPDTGMPLNQIAVISAYDANELSSCYYYYRCTLVKNPFPTGKDNLCLLFQKNRKVFESKRPSKSRASRSDIVRQFIYTLGALYIKEEEAEASAKICVDMFEKGLVEGNINGKDDLLQILVLLLSSLYHLESTEGGLRRANLILLATFMKAVLDRWLPVYGSALEKQANFAVTVHVFLKWLACSASFSRQAADVPQWLDLCESLKQLLNTIAGPLIFDLPPRHASLFEEDIELRGFLPMDSILSEEYFANKLLVRKEKESKARVRSIILLAQVCSDQEILPFKATHQGGKISFSTFKVNREKQRSNTVLSEAPSFMKEVLSPLRLDTKPVELTKDVDEVIVFAAGGKSSRTSSTSATRPVAKSPVGYERNDSVLAPPSLEAEKAWNSFSGNLGTFAFNSILAHGKHSETVPSSHNNPVNRSRLSDPLSFDPGERYGNAFSSPPSSTTRGSYTPFPVAASIPQSNPAAPVISRTSQPPPGFGISPSMGHTGMPQQPNAFSFSGMESTLPVVPNPFQGNPLSWLHDAAATKREQPADLFRFPFKMQSSTE